MGNPGELMQVPDEIRDSVVFLYSQQDLGPAAMGTAFFVAITAGDESQPLTPGVDGHPYLVTARHVIDGIRDYGTDGKVHVRVNLRDGGIAFVETEADEWRSLSDGADLVDIAVLPWGSTPQLLDYKVIPVVPMFVTDELITQDNIGLGDDLFMTGLFVNHFGERRNIPIVRMGNIATMPGEPVATDLGSMTAYLIESRSVGGLSGSPVFVEVDPLRSVTVDPLGGTVRASTARLSRRFYLLGLVHGHWDAQFAAGDGASVPDPLVNMGVAIVVPTQKIMEVLNMPKLVRERRQDEEDKRRGRLTTADSV